MISIPRTIQRAILLLSCTFLGLICGTLYMYSSYSPQFAKRLKYSASDSSYIALSGTIGIAIGGPIAGILVDKRGYTAALAIGGMLIMGGYMVMKRQFDLVYQNLSLSCCLTLVIGIGSTAINSVTLKCCAVSFPTIRGIATALPLSLYGLSALFYSVAGSILYPGNTSGFLGFVTSSIFFILIVCSPSIILADKEHKVKRAAGKYKPISADSSPLSPSVTIDNDSTLECSLLKDPKFWLLFIITGSLASLGQMYIYSVGYMVKALVSYTIRNEVDITPVLLQETETIIQHDQQFQVGLLSIANCLGRIISGILGDVITQSFHKPRSWLLFFPSIGMMITQLLSLTTKNYDNLPWNSLLTGLFYGFTFCILPLIVGDTFGLENFSYNWGVVNMAPIIPSYYLTMLFGSIYDSKSQFNKQQGGLVCMLGNQCYNSIFKITLSVSIFSIIVVVILTIGPNLLSHHKNIPLTPKQEFNEKFK
ncbi:putative transporter MCH1 [Spathaspora sp. JA1]|nr:putative transporter MCH1 [Spathaspora sp. JA1]